MAGARRDGSDGARRPSIALARSSYAGLPVLVRPLVHAAVRRVPGPGSDKMIVDVDSTTIRTTTDKQDAAPTYERTFGHLPLLAIALRPTRSSQGSCGWRAQHEDDRRRSRRVAHWRARPAPRDSGATPLGVGVDASLVERTLPSCETWPIIAARMRTPNSMDLDHQVSGQTSWKRQRTSCQDVGLSLPPWRWWQCWRCWRCPHKRMPAWEAGTALPPTAVHRATPSSTRRTRIRRPIELTRVMCRPEARTSGCRLLRAVATIGSGAVSRAGSRARKRPTRQTLGQPLAVAQQP